MKSVSVVIVSHNTSEQIVECIESLRTMTSPDVDYEVIVVDNASTDDSVEVISRRFPEIDLVALPVNSGFARACNLGARLAAGQYLCFLNPDAIAVTDALGALRRLATMRPDAGVYGGRSIHRDGSLDARSCRARPSLWSHFCFASGLSATLRDSRWFDPESLGHWRRDSVREVDVVTGYLFFVDDHLWTALGGFDEQFFMYGEDVDFCVRAGERGHRPVITPDAVVTHLGGASSRSPSEKLVLLMKGKATYARKHWSGMSRHIAITCLVVGSAVRAWAYGRVAKEQSPWVEVWSRREEWLGGYELPVEINSPRER